MVYPSKRNPYKIVSSIRLETLRDSIDDYDYLYLLEQKIGRDKALGFITQIDTLDQSNWISPMPTKETFLEIRDRIAKTIEDLPTIEIPASSKNITAGENMEFEILATDQPGNGPIDLTVSELPEGATFIITGAGKGIFSWTPSISQAQQTPYTITFSATNNKGNTETQQIHITVYKYIIHGSVKEQNNTTPVENAEISLMTNNGSMIIMSKFSDNEGKFDLLLHSLDDGDYLVTIKKQNYEPFNKLIAINAGSNNISILALLSKCGYYLQFEAEDMDNLHPFLNRCPF